MSQRAKTFVIIYSGRTGSSPIVNILARQPGICVPVFENLDSRFIGQERAAEVPAILDRVLSTGRLEGAKLPEHLPRWPGDETPAAIGFKWRPWGGEGVWDQIFDVFRRHEVVLFVLSRRDFVELVSSLYITTHGNDLQKEVRISKHPQFGLALKEREASERADIERLQAMTFPVRPELLRQGMRHQARQRERLLGLARRAHARGVPVRAIYYEDFTADNAGFIRAMLDEIGYVPEGPLDLTSAFEKVMKVPARSRLRGLDRWLWLPTLRYQMGRYRRHGRDLEALVAASRAARPAP